jgi:hypothetical protein
MEKAESLLCRMELVSITTFDLYAEHRLTCEGKEYILVKDGKGRVEGKIWEIL